METKNLLQESETTSNGENSIIDGFELRYKEFKRKLCTKHKDLMLDSEYIKVTLSWFYYKGSVDMADRIQKDIISAEQAKKPS